METKDIIYELRTKKGLSQEELAEKVYVTRQAVSRWENGDTVPNTETLKLLSREFDVSINTLLGSPRQLVCQCCGMPLEVESISREKDGIFNEEYCKWCYADGNFCYSSLAELTDFLVEHMADENRPPEQVRAYLEQQLLTRKDVKGIIFDLKNNHGYRDKPDDSEGGNSEQVIFKGKTADWAQ